MKCASAGEKQKNPPAVLQTLSRTLLKKGLAKKLRRRVHYRLRKKRLLSTRLLEPAENLAGPV